MPAARTSTSSVKVIPGKCSGCRVCQLMCSMAHHEGAFNPRKGLVRVEVNRSPGIDTPLPMIDMPHVCRQCRPAPCAEACPEEAIIENERSGMLEVNEALCIGCEICVNECEYGMMFMQNGKAAKCDLCGGEPMCVRFCPTGALVIG